MAKILLVEDDQKFADAVVHWLRGEHHTVDHVSRCSDGAYYADTFKYDLLILDWELPDGCGTELCGSLRKRGLVVPIIMFTGRKKLTDRIEGLDSGADDYVMKPCDPSELAARIRAMLRRKPHSEHDLDELFGHGITLDLKSRNALVGGVSISLTAREFEILRLLMYQSPECLSAPAISERLAVFGVSISSSAVKTYISQMRAKFGAANCRLPVTFADGGYRFG